MMNGLHGMKRKYLILGVLTFLCLLGTGYYAWTLYDAHRKQVAEWNEGAKTAFEEALWLEVNKRTEVPFYSSSSVEHGMTTLQERIPDSVSVMTDDGWRRYKIDRYKYDNSLQKETRSRGDLSILLKIHPLSVDVLSVCWDSILSEKEIVVGNRIRYIYTDLKLQNDTVFSSFDKRFSRLDSLVVKYLGFRCEHEITAYISHSNWFLSLTRINGCILLLPWLLLVLLFISYPNLEEWVQRKMIHEKIVEKTVQVVDVQMDKAGIFQLPDGTIFDSIAGLLDKDGVQQRLQPQSVSLLKLFINKEEHQLTSEEICMKLWSDTGYTYRLHSAISRLRNDLKAVKSELLVSCSYGLYELKLPISSNKSENCPRLTK